MARTIRNGKSYPRHVRAAAIAEVAANPVKSYKDVAVDRNISEATIRNWAAIAGVVRASRQHPNTAAGVKAYWANYAAIKAFNTPILVIDHSKNVTGIEYQGKIYK